VDSKSIRDSFSTKNYPQIRH